MAVDPETPRPRSRGAYEDPRSSLSEEGVAAFANRKTAVMVPEKERRAVAATKRCEKMADHAGMQARMAARVAEMKLGRKPD